MRYGRLIPQGTGGTVILECPEPLIDLAKTCEGIDEFVVFRFQTLCLTVVTQRAPSFVYIDRLLF
jgi:hypothetical protein